MIERGSPRPYRTIAGTLAVLLLLLLSGWSPVDPATPPLPPPAPNSGAHEAATAVLGHRMLSPVLQLPIHSRPPWRSGTAPSVPYSQVRPLDGAAPNQTVESVGTGPGPIWATYDPADGYVYVEDSGISPYSSPGDELILNGTSVVADPTVGFEPFAAAFDAADGDIYVVNTQSGNVSVLNGTTVVASVSVGANPQYDTYDAADGEIYVPNCNSDTVSVIQGTKVVATVPVGGCPWNATYDPHHEEVYVPNLDSGTVSVINGTTVAATVTVGLEPWSGTYDPSIWAVDVPNAASDSVSVINGSTVAATVDLGSITDPLYGGYDAADREVYIADYAASNISLLNGTRLNGSVTVGSNPLAATYDAQNGEMYVANSGGSGNISVLDGSQVVEWLGGGSNGQNAIYVNATGDIYIPNLGSDNVSVVVDDYTVQFDESGLPSAAQWWVNLSSLGTSWSSAAGTPIVVQLPNGVYNFTIASSDKSYRAGGGAVTVASATVLENVRFTRVTFGLAFTEFGLPLGTAWTVTLGGLSNASTGSSIGFRLANGTYPYRVGGVSGWTTPAFGGNVTVRGAVQSIRVNWSRVNYTVRVTETGLKSGTFWWFNLTGSPPISTKASALSFAAFNGSFPYTVSSADPTYGASPGTLVVNGGPVDESVEFARVTFDVNFTESGLPDGTNWSVLLGGRLNSSTTPTISVPQANGSYPYVLVDVPGWHAPAYKGVVSVTGAPVLITVPFVRTTYSVTFAENGLPSGSRWSLALNGTTNSAIGAIQFGGLPNGTYEFRVGTSAGYTVSPSNGTVVLKGGSVSRTIEFSAASSGNGISVLSTTDLGIVVLGVGAIAAVAVVLLWRRRRGPRAD